MSSKSWLWFQILGQFHHFLIIYQIMKREKSQLKPLQWFLFIWLIIMMMMMVIMMETGINGKRRHKTVCYVLLCCIFFIHITASNSHFETDKRRLRSYDLSNQSVKLILCIVQGNLPHFTFSPWLDEQNTVCWKPTHFFAKSKFDYISWIIIAMISDTFSKKFPPNFWNSKAHIKIWPKVFKLFSAHCIPQCFVLHVSHSLMNQF